MTKQPKTSTPTRIVAITGGGAGIGRALSQRFAQDKDTHVIILERDEKSAQTTLDEIHKSQGSASFILCDIANHTLVKETISSIFEKHQRLDVLINNAGISHIGNAANTSEADYDRIMNVNAKGVYNTIHATIQPMIDQGGGVILNMASIAAEIALADRFVYSASKGAVMTMTRCVAKDFIDKNIRCNCICPGRVHTPFVDHYLETHYPDNKQEMFEKLSKFQPIGRMASPEEIAHLAFFLCSPEAAFITGASYDIDGGAVPLR